MSKDKIRHRDYSFEITLLLSFLIGWLLAVIATFFIGVAKELIWKYVWKKEFSFPDIRANIQGIFIGVINFALISYLLTF